MSGFYSIRSRARNAILSPSRPAPPDPYAPSSPNYAERNRESVTELPNGLVRVDIGEPAHWAAREAAQRKQTPSTSRGQADAPLTVGRESVPAAPAVQPPAPPKVPRQDHRAITRNP
jgi:hypothetical protein